MDDFTLSSLPKYYDENLVGLFSQGPDVVFAYWELSGSQWEMVSASGGLLIRLYRVYEAGNFEYEYVVADEAEPLPDTRSWYFNRLEADTVYSFEVGCRLPDGSFFPLLKSGRVTTPPRLKFDIMPKKSVIKVKYTTPPFFPVEIEKAGTLKISADVDDVLESMPFYMGCGTDSTD